MIEFWFDFGSNYSYLSAMRIEALARERGLTVEWKPFLLGVIFKSFGWNSSPFVEQKQKGAYMWRDMERQCAKYGLAWTRPTTFPRRALLPLRVALVGNDEGWAAPFNRRIMERNFVRDRDIDSIDAVSEVLWAMDLDAEYIIAKAQSDEYKNRLRTQTELAQSKGIFGAPTFVVNGELYWGNDRLEDALRDLDRGRPGLPVVPLAPA